MQNGFKLNDAALKEALDASPSDRRLTPDRIEAAIASEQYIVIPETCLTICVLTMQNGFNVSAEAACADKANFNKEIGRTVARRNALNQVWPLEGYLLKQRIFEEDGA